MYQAGWSRKEIAVRPTGNALHGYGMWNNRALSWHTPLYARTLYLRDAQGGVLHFCLLDLGYVTYAMRAAIVDRLEAEWGDTFSHESLVLTCTHTHSGPGGCSHDAFYNVVTPGFVPANLAAVVDATVDAIIAAHDSAAPTEFTLSDATFADDVPVAWNRSVGAHNRNPDVIPRTDDETHLAIDRGMTVLQLQRDGQTQALLSLFGVHGTCVGNKGTKYSSDNKGCAALAAEASLRAAGATDPVALFAQTTAGDVSPHFQGPNDVARRKKLKGEAEYRYAERNGQLQTDHALDVVATAPTAEVTGTIDSILTYVDMSAIDVAPAFANGNESAHTADAALGVAFFRGTRVDGAAMAPPIAWIASRLSRALHAFRQRRMTSFSPEDQTYFQRLYAAHGPKEVLLEAGRNTILGLPLARLPLPSFIDPLVGELKREARDGAIVKSDLIPSVMPLQIVRIGSLAFVCAPGEWTTTAGRRLVASVADRLEASGVTQALMVSYANDYMGYVTTYEEYQAQCYEGGNTLFGQWTLAGFQTRFDDLAAEMLRPVAEREHDVTTRPAPAPADELARRTDLRPPR